MTEKRDTTFRPWPTDPSLQFEWSYPEFTTAPAAFGKSARVMRWELINKAEVKYREDCAERGTLPSETSQVRIGFVVLYLDERDPYLLAEIDEPWFTCPELIGKQPRQRHFSLDEFKKARKWVKRTHCKLNEVARAEHLRWVIDNQKQHERWRKEQEQREAERREAQLESELNDRIADESEL